VVDGQTRIVHFTHVDNLPGIVARRALLSDSMIQSLGGPSRDCADASIKSKRKQIPVHVAPFGRVCDYVPFYFAPRSPMLYRIFKGNLDTYQYGQTPLIYIASSVERALAAQLPWVGSDGNCAAALTEHYNNWIELQSSVDWPLMQERYWHNTEDDGDRVRRRQAEFLVHKRFPIDLVRGIVVKSEAIRAKAMESVGESIDVRVHPSWYF
jgi:ssDNA thymidine ADP-ribosyltransferase, DarT